MTTRSARDLVQKHRPRILKNHITEPVSDDEWKVTDAIRVICRFRPPNKRELAYSDNKHITDTPPRWQSDHSVQLQRGANDKTKRKSASSRKPFKCTLDSILRPKTTQKELFYLIGQPMILQVLDGFNSTVFAYGQSGSGKTYTMFGPEDDATNVKQFGLIPRCFIYLFQKLNESLSDNGGNLQGYKVSMECLQIYKSDLLDLLNPNSSSKKGKHLVVKTDFTNDSVFVQNLRKVDINTVEEAFACLTEAQSNRIVAGHALNAVSSRSHMLVIVNIFQRAIDGTVKRSKLNFGDLAGSEDLTKALGKNPNAERRKEAIAINSSLSALTTAMSFLSKGKKPSYRDSHLTHILKDSLGGNSKTIMFVACSPHIYNRNETIRALRFAATAKKVRNKVKKNEEQSTASMQKRIKELELQVASLQAQLVETRGKKNVYKKKLQKQADQMARYKKKLSKSSPRNYQMASPKFSACIDADGLPLQMHPNVEHKWSTESDPWFSAYHEEQYLSDISQLRKTLDESLITNTLLNKQIDAKNIELEQCNNQIAKMMREFMPNSDKKMVKFPKRIALNLLVPDTPDIDEAGNTPDDKLDYLMRLQAHDRVRRKTMLSPLVMDRHSVNVQRTLSDRSINVKPYDICTRSPIVKRKSVDVTFQI